MNLIAALVPVAIVITLFAIADSDWTAPVLPVYEQIQSECPLVVLEEFADGARVMTYRCVLTLPPNGS